MTRGINWLNTYLKIYATIMTSTIQKQYYQNITMDLESNGHMTNAHTMAQLIYMMLLIELHGRS
jgi:transcription elongation factor GreA-like protein